MAELGASLLILAAGSLEELSLFPSEAFLALFLNLAEDFVQTNFGGLVRMMHF